ncbi:MAG: glycosyltransferase family 2 protein [Paracoccaceae bacterium]
MPIFGKQPAVSVLMPNYNGAEYLESAMRSVLAQSTQNIELIFSDDASSDGSVDIARSLMDADSRVKVLAATVNQGPGSARNHALEVAQGDWIAIVDSDDLIHPRRLERLLEMAKHLQTSGIADDLTCFGSGFEDSIQTLFGDLSQSRPLNVTVEVLLASELELGGRTPFGYLKPLMRRDRLKNLRYRPDLRLGEDHDFYARYLLEGGHIHLVAQSYYLYRRHENSFSHRLSVLDVQGMIDAQEVLLGQYPDMSETLRNLFEERHDTLHASLKYEKLVKSLKNQKYALALGMVVRHPALFSSLSRSIKEHYLQSNYTGDSVKIQSNALIKNAEIENRDGYTEAGNSPSAVSVNADEAGNSRRNFQAGVQQ